MYVGRVIVDSHGITFTRILQKDSGLYYVKAHNKAGSASGSANLKGLTIVEEFNNCKQNIFNNDMMIIRVFQL